MVFYAQSTKRDRQTETDRQSMCVREREGEREREWGKSKFSDCTLVGESQPRSPQKSYTGCCSQ